jgi:hypothetical protein
MTDTPSGPWSTLEESILIWLCAGATARLDLDGWVEMRLPNERRRFVRPAFFDAAQARFAAGERPKIRVAPPPPPPLQSRASAANRQHAGRRSR